MLRIRREQVDVLTMPHRARFEQRAVEAVAACWPAIFAELGPEGTRTAVREGRERAARYGLSTEQEQLRFINLQCLLGWDFDRRDEGAWARVILEDRALAPGARLDWVGRRALEGPR